MTDGSTPLKSSYELACERFKERFEEIERQSEEMRKLGLSRECLNLAAENGHWEHIYNMATMSCVDPRELERQYMKQFGQNINAVVHPDGSFTLVNSYRPENDFEEFDEEVLPKRRNFDEKDSGIVLPEWARKGLAIAYKVGKVALPAACVVGGVLLVGSAYADEDTKSQTNSDGLLKLLTDPGWELEVSPLIGDVSGAGVVFGHKYGHPDNKLSLRDFSARVGACYGRDKWLGLDEKTETRVLEGGTSVRNVTEKEDILTGWLFEAGGNNDTMPKGLRRYLLRDWRLRFEEHTDRHYEDKDSFFTFPDGYESTVCLSTKGCVRSRKFELSLEFPEIYIPAQKIEANGREYRIPRTLGLFPIPERTRLRLDFRYFDNYGRVRIMNKKTGAVEREVERSRPRLWVPSVYLPDHNLSVQFGWDDDNPYLRSGDRFRHTCINQGLDLSDISDSPFVPKGAVLSYQYIDQPHRVGHDQHAGGLYLFWPLKRMSPEDTERYVRHALPAAMREVERENIDMMEAPLQRATGHFPEYSSIPALVLDLYYRDKNNQRYRVTAPVAEYLGLSLGWQKRNGEESVTLGAVFRF